MKMHEIDVPRMREFTITLTEDQVQTLADLFHRVGGSPNGRRGDTQELLTLFANHGIYGRGEEVYDRSLGSVYFPDRRR